MDLAPFATINPCGYAGLKVTQLQAMMETTVTVSEVAHDLMPYMARQFKHTAVTQTHYTTWEQMKTDGAL
jgi:lipoyl(octanoyl) transferase